MSQEENAWRKCSSCKRPIAFGSRYYVCSVSTCNGQRTGYVFCGVPCWEVHLPAARHKDAAAIEMKAPAAAEPTRRIIATGSSSPAAVEREVLVVASRLKDYIQKRGGMNTSGRVMEVLSDYLRAVCDQAMDNARAEGRKTILDRDLLFLRDKI
jgi:hypothetical protein